jgi:TetR/AcrR family transcriptional regulator
MSKTEETVEEQILVAAFNVFVAKGFESTKMQDIADDAGIKRTVLNYYFRSKDLLYVKIAKTIVGQVLPNVLKILNGNLPFEQKIEAYVNNFIDTGVKNPFLPLFLLKEMNNLGTTFIEKVLDGQHPNIDPFLNHVQDEIKKGNIVNIDPLQIFIHIEALCAFPILAKPMVMLVTNSTENEYKTMMEDRKKEITRFVLKGIKP